MTVKLSTNLNSNCRPETIETGAQHRQQIQASKSWTLDLGLPRLSHRHHICPVAEELFEIIQILGDLDCLLAQRSQEFERLDGPHGNIQQEKVQQTFKKPWLCCSPKQSKKKTGMHKGDQRRVVSHSGKTWQTTEHVLRCSKQMLETQPGLKFLLRRHQALAQQQGIHVHTSSSWGATRSIPFFPQTCHKAALFFWVLSAKRVWSFGIHMNPITIGSLQENHVCFSRTAGCLPSFSQGLVVQKSD